MEKNPEFSAIVHEVLNEKNYEIWSVCIKNYLLSQDLWDNIIEEKSTTKGLNWRKKNATKGSDWRKKNAKALHAIQISCGSKLLHEIKEYKLAKEAWYFLAQRCSPQKQGDSELASSSSVQEIEPVGQASHKFNSAINREDWLKSIIGDKDNEAIEEKAGAKEKAAIRKVPPIILRIQYFKICHEPSVVSIGPYHHCDPRLQQVEKLKPQIAKQFVDQLTKSKDVGKFFDQFEKEFDPVIKDLYDHENDISEEEFMRMMFLDGCFILYFIYCIQFDEVEILGLEYHHIALVQQDLLLVENQLPFQVLEMLMSSSGLSSGYAENMLEEFTEAMNTCGLPIWTRYQEVRIEKPLHLLDVLWIKLLGNKEEFVVDVEPPHENKNRIKRHLFHGVKELAAVGIHFRPNSSGFLSDIKFRSHGIYGMLTLPRMTIERSTMQMFLNLIAHEACLDNRKKFWFTSYICFLDLLIDHAEDVKALRTAGILVNYLDSDEEVANLFNEIPYDLLPKVDTYKEVKLKIQCYLGNKPKLKMASWVAEVIHDHFRSPWTIIALLAGIIVISLASFQTYFTIFPRSKGDGNGRS